LPRPDGHDRRDRRNDTITGTPGDDVIVTGAGRDWIRARAGDDTICTG
jgi:hypothetical protein